MEVTRVRLLPGDLNAAVFGVSWPSGGLGSCTQGMSGSG